MNLQRHVRDLKGGLGGIEFCHRTILARLKPAIQRLRGGIAQRAGGLHPHGHVHDVFLDQLEFPDQFAELFARLGIIDRDIECRLRLPDRAHGDIHPRGVQPRQRAR